jgi:MoaA/NifB/PqqE/SkfB family radical SAM enzyme
VKLFNTIALEISSRCNRSCKFCPVAYNHRPDENMDLDLLDKALTELGEMNYRGRIELYIYNEPLREWQWALDVLRMMRAQVPRACLMIATNGDYAKNGDRLAELYDAGLNQLLINCYSKGLYEKRVGWIDCLKSAHGVVDGNVYNYVSPKKRVVQMLDKSEPETFGTGIFRLVNRAGNIPEFMPATCEPVSRMCVKPFRFLNIDWTGRALVCCMDYHSDLSYGNVKNKTLVELWNYPVMNAYRTRLLKKDRSLPLCRSCDCHQGAFCFNVPSPGKPVATAAEVQALYDRNVAARQLTVVPLEASGVRRKPPAG